MNWHAYYCARADSERFSSVQFSRSLMSNSLQPHGLQHSRLPRLSPTPEAHSNSCPSCRWCHPTISYSVINFSSPFNLSQNRGLFQWVSSLYHMAKVLEFQLHHQSFQWIFRTYFPLGLTGWTSLQSKGLSRVFSNISNQKHQFFSAQFFFMAQLSHPYMTTGKTIALTRQNFVGKVMSLLFYMLYILAIAFLPRSNCILISWLHSLSAVILEPKKIKSLMVSIASTSICYDMMRQDDMILVFWKLSFKPVF